MRDDPVSRIADIKKVNAVLARTREKFITAKEPDYKSMPKKDRPAASKAFHIEWMRQYKELKPLLARVNRLARRKYNFTKSPHGGWFHNSMK